MRLSCKLLVASLSLGLLLGCSKPRDNSIPVRGRVTNAGTPLSVAGREARIGMVQVKFLRVNDDGSTDPEPWTATVDEQGKFEVPGKDGFGLPPGKYKIAVFQYDPHPTDKLGGKFNEKNTKIVRPVEDGKDIEIDLSKPSG